MFTARQSLRCVCLTALFGCSDTPPDDSPRWVRVARDANYTIYIDTGRMGPFDNHFAGPGEWGGNAYDVWYRTDHAQTRIHDKTNQGFNREVVHSIIDCDSLRFRVAGVDMSMGDGRVIIQQRLTTKELANQKWRHVELGTAEELAARAACHFVSAIATLKR